MNTAALILAAGKNTRFDTGIPKSLHQIGDSTLLERHIRQFHRLGIQNVAVVTGYRCQMIKEYLDKLSPMLDHPITLIHNSEYEKANGLSIRVAKDWIATTGVSYFLCTMSDHLFSSDFYDFALRKFQTRGRNDDILNLVVDKPGQHNSYIDLDDVTRVKINDNDAKGLKIERVSKLMSTFNYFDTGFFILEKSVFDYLDICAAQEKYSISDLVNHLADIDKSYALDLTGQYWNDVDTPEDFDVVQNQLHLLKTIK